ncbi:MAG: hypothetical protein LBV42_00210 [Methanobrevibacter sp.]|jgi:hypothetical protein|nr:hypothetical protein [Methanobrevibacter sp.]
MTNYDKSFLNKDNKFDCIKFKDELQARPWKNSKAKNMKEHVKYVNKKASKAPLNKNKKN